MTRLVLIIALTACGSEAPVDDTDAAVDEVDATPAGVPIQLLQANVGNVDLECVGDYKSKLCSIAAEGRIAAGTAALDPDVVVFQELVSASQCAGIDENNVGKVCHADHAASIADQIRRLLGPDYTIACDSRNGFECTAIHTRAGTIAGCDRGSLCSVEPLAVDAGCNDGFSVTPAVVEIDGFGAVTVVNGHPPAGPAVACRTEQLARIFAGEAGDIDAPMILSGDFNLDPFRNDDASVAVWRQFVGAGEAFHYHSGAAEHDPPYFTSVTLIGASTLDHVVSNVATGRCATLGEAEDTERLDGGDGMDHRALLCELRL